MQAGMLNHRITLSRPTTTNVEGEATTSYQDLGTYWALVQPQSGGESVSFTQVQAERVFKITLRANAVAIQPKDRVTFKGRQLEVTAILDQDEQGVLQFVTAKENV
jgi:SPP1 family predicted phage head-tail adaptor